MTKEEKERILASVKGKDVSEVVCLLMENGNTYSRRLLKFLQWLAKWIPIAVMMWHSFAMWDFAHNPREMFIVHSEHWPSYTFIYFMLYLLPVVIIVFSKLFCLCWVYRIPFFYYFGVNAVHITYWSWYTTNEMVGASLSVIVMTAAFYTYWLVGKFLTDTKLGRSLFAIKAKKKQEDDTDEGKSGEPQKQARHGKKTI